MTSYIFGKVIAQLKKKNEINAVIKRSEKITKTKQLLRFNETFHDLCVNKLASIIKDTTHCLNTLFFQTGRLDLFIYAAEQQDIRIVNFQSLSDHHNLLHVSILFMSICIMFLKL